MREKCFNKNKLNPKIVNARHELYRTMKVVYNFTVISSSKELSVASYIMCTSAVIKTNIRSLFLTTFLCSLDFIMMHGFIKFMHAEGIKIFIQAHKYVFVLSIIQTKRKTGFGEEAGKIAFNILNRNSASPFPKKAGKEGGEKKEKEVKKGVSS